MQADYIIPIEGRSVALGENGVVFLSDTTPSSPGTAAIAVDSSSGQILWNHPSQSGNGVLITAALANGSAVLTAC